MKTERGRIKKNEEGRMKDRRGRGGEKGEKEKRYGTFLPRGKVK